MGGRFDPFSPADFVLNAHFMAEEDFATGLDMVIIACNN
jgi:hypothetical protein